MLLDILKRNGIDLKRKTAKEYAGPCPWCGGDDRFIVNTDQDLYWCRGCKKGGDAITFLREYKGLTYEEAAEAVGKEPRQTYRPIARPTWTPRETTTASGDWKARAKAFVDQAIKTLWADSRHREELTSRGLSDEAIRARGLGWNDRDLWQTREAWGLEPVMNDKGKPKKVWLPRGLVIPCYEGGDIIRIRIRRPEGDPRYYLLPGSDTRAMTFGTLKAVVVVESELDAILLNDKAGDLVSCMALGNAQARPDVEADQLLRQADIILNALDSDGAGASEAWHWWAGQYPTSTRWPCIEGKDPSDMYKAGVDIRLWIQAGLPESLQDERKGPGEGVGKGEGLEASNFDFAAFERDYGFDLAERLAIMTVDGHLTDAEALKALGI